MLANSISHLPKTQIPIYNVNRVLCISIVNTQISVFILKITFTMGQDIGGYYSFICRWELTIKNEWISNIYRNAHIGHKLCIVHFVHITSDNDIQYTCIEDEDDEVINVRYRTHEEEAQTRIIIKNKTKQNYATTRSEHQDHIK